MTLTLVDIPLELDTALRQRAEQQHKPVDQVAVDAMKAGLGLIIPASGDESRTNLAASIRTKFGPLGGVELADVPRGPMREPVDFRE